MDQSSDGADTFSLNETRSEAIAFVEFEKAFLCINTITNSSDLKASDDALEELRRIFDKYLELPSLLDHHIESMVGELTRHARNCMDDKEINFRKSSLPRALSALYALSKVRGRKKIQKFLPHQVRDVEAVLETLQALDKEMENNNNQGIADDDGCPELWESMHTLWNWMGILSLVPFNTNVVVEDSKILELISLAKAHFFHAGPTREMAAACLASWLCRPDFENSKLQDFLQWSRDILEAFEMKKENIYVALAVFQTLVTILKVSSSERQTLLKSMESLWPVVLKISESKPSNLLLRKYLVKWWARLGTTYLPPRVLSWRYNLGRTSLKENLLKSNERSRDTKETNNRDDDYFFLIPDEVEEAMGQVIGGLIDASTVVRWSAAKGVGRVTSRLPAICAEDVVDSLLTLFEDVEKDNNWHGGCLAFAELARRGLLLPSQLPQVIPKLVDAMHYDVPRRQTSVGANVRDAACYTYWAIARAYSPEVLKPFVGQICESVILAFLFDREVNCRRAASAAFQELVGRQGATNFKHGISILTVADYFALGNRNDAYKSIAQHVAQFDEYRKPMINHLFRIKLCHWDPAIRVLSSQALSGLTLLDTEYIESTVIPYLLENCLDPKDVQLRHGCVLGLAEIILAYSTSDRDAKDLLSKDTLAKISEIVQTIEKRRLYRGKGGELMRAAVCRLIECISIAVIPLTVPQQVRLLDSIDACLPHPNETIQNQAGRALFALMRSYFPVGAKGPSDRLQKRVVSKYATEVRNNANPAATRGFALALGNLPSKLLAPSSQVLDISLSSLCRVSRPDATVGGEKDAETRRNAIVALSRICETVGLQPAPGENQCLVGMSPVQVGHVFTALFRGLDDYNMERRGDVGSMSRIAAMNGLVTLSILVTAQTNVQSDEYFNHETCVKLVGGLLKQLSEKLDAVRSEAGTCLQRVLEQSNPPIPHIPGRDQLVDIFLKKGDGKDTVMNWSDAAVTFPLMIECLAVDELFHYVISGLVISVGSLTQSVNKHASSALLSWTKAATKSQKIRLGQAFLRLFQDHQHDGRVILPLLKTTELLMNRLFVDCLIEDDDFSFKLKSFLEEEVKGCNDIHRLTSIVNVSLGLLTENESRRDHLSLACKMLMHSFPRIRRITAENLYVKLLENVNIDDQHPVMALLLESSWDADLPADQVKDMAMSVAAALNSDRSAEEAQFK